MLTHPDIKRRTLLAGLISGLAAGCASVAPSQARRVIVIGAGFAGLSAARALRQAGCQVTVLEARNRAGGRVNTDRSLGFALDLGPSWLHGGPLNPLKAVAEGARIRTHVTQYDNFRFSKRVNRRRVQVPREGLLATAQEFGDAMATPALWKELRQRKGALASFSDLSVNEVFEAAIHDLEAHRGPIDPGVVALQRWFLESNLAAPLEEVGASALLDESDTAPPEELLPRDDRYVTDGMDRLTGLLALDLDIRYEEVVRTIEWRPGAVVVGTQSGEWRADCAVVSLPVRVLQRGDVTFTPSLPSELTEPLGRLRMGLLNKFCMVFPHAFWNTQVDFLAYYADPAPLYYAWLNLMRYSGVPALVGFTSGNLAREVDALTDDEIALRVMRRIRQSGGRRVPEPVAVRASHWATDPYAGGSYSFPGIGASGADRSALTVPVAGTLYFAGEATHRDDPATVHGAWWSGLRAAKQILGSA